MNVQDEIRELRERIAELEKQEEGKQGFPQYDDDYWYVDSDTEVMKMVWHGDEFDKGRLSIDNVSKTRDQAEFTVEKLRVEAELRKFSRPFTIGRNNYMMGMDTRINDLLTIERVLDKYQGVIYFESREKVKEAIDTIGEDRIRKYIFEVED